MQFFFQCFHLIFIDIWISPEELCPSCRSGLGAKSDPMPDDPRDEIPCFLFASAFVAPTINLFRQRRNSIAAKLPFDRCIVS